MILTSQCLNSSSEEAEEAIARHGRWVNLKVAVAAGWGVDVVVKASIVCLLQVHMRTKVNPRRTSRIPATPWNN
jgi:hypothetical protein